MCCLDTAPATGCYISLDMMLICIMHWSQLSVGRNYTSSKGPTSLQIQTHDSRVPSPLLALGARKWAGEERDHLGETWLVIYELWGSRYSFWQQLVKCPCQVLLVCVDRYCSAGGMAQSPRRLRNQMCWSKILDTYTDSFQFLRWTF